MVFSTNCPGTSEYPDAKNNKNLNLTLYYKKTKTKPKQKTHNISILPHTNTQILSWNGSQN